MWGQVDIFVCFCKEEFSVGHNNHHQFNNFKLLLPLFITRCTCILWCSPFYVEAWLCSSADRSFLQCFYYSLKMIGQDSRHTQTHIHRYTHTETHTGARYTVKRFADPGLPIHSMWQSADESNSHSLFSTTLVHTEHLRQDLRQVHLLTLYRSICIRRWSPEVHTPDFFNLIVYDLVCYSKSLIQYLMSLTEQCRLLCKTLKAVDIFCIPYFDVEFSGWR